MEHHHRSHGHTHSVTPVNPNRAFITGIVLNLAFVIIEFAAGFYYNSLALMSDAGHNLSDVATLALSLFAFKLAQRKATSKYTFGFHKGTILASLANAIILLIAVGSIGWEAVRRFLEPAETQGSVISIVSGIGILVNGLSALLFFKLKNNDLNAKGAYLHLATDALVSLGVVIAGFLISYTGIKWIDPLISLLVMGIVIYGTWGLLTESLRLSLDAVPSAIELEKIKEIIKKTEGVNNVHHVHIWAIGTSKNAMTAHLILNENLTAEQVSKIKQEVRHKLYHLDIHHVTLETESSSCNGKNC